MIVRACHADLPIVPVRRPHAQVRCHDRDCHDWLYSDLDDWLVDGSVDLFQDRNWDLFAKVRTKEDESRHPGGWRAASLYVLKDYPETACLYFGDGEYEGADYSYRYSGGVLLDTDNEEIDMEIVERMP